MGGLDHFLAQSLESTIRENLGKQTVSKIEKRLFEKHGISLTESVKQFQKLDLVLREHFGKGADGMEEKFFENLCSINLRANEKNMNTNSKNWITITEPSLTSTILEAFGDEDKKKIISSVNEESKIVYQILKESKIPQTSGYRKINALIEDGILIIDGHIETKDGKKVNKYRTVFKNVQIHIIENDVTVDVQIDDTKTGQESSILTAMSEL